MKGSFIPSKSIRELRDLTRYKRKVIESISSEKNRIHKLLEDANIKLSSVVSNLNVATATKIIDLMISGEEDVKELIKLRHGSMHCSIEDLASSLKGKLTTHHRFMLQTVKESIASKRLILDKLNLQIDKQLDDYQLLVDSQLLSTIPGVGKDGASYILAEIGNKYGSVSY